MESRLNRRATLVVAGMALAVVALVTLLAYSLQASPLSTLTISPTSAAQETNVTLSGSGFSPNETVAIWVTAPDFTVQGLAEVVASGDGAFSLTFAVDQSLAIGRHTFTARGKSSGREEYADLQVSLGRGPTPSTAVTLQLLSNSVTQGTTVVLRGAGYGATEPVALWIRYPDGGTFELGNTQSGPGGQFEYSIGTSNAPVGRYTLSAQGISSKRMTFIEFEVRVGDLLRESGVASMTAQPASADQQRNVVFTGSGFSANELVTIWATLPDYSTAFIGNVQVNAQGGFTTTIYLSEAIPAGNHTFSAFGNTSKRQATLRFYLDPGGPARQP